MRKYFYCDEKWKSAKANLYSIRLLIFATTTARQVIVSELPHSLLLLHNGLISLFQGWIPQVEAEKKNHELPNAFQEASSAWTRFLQYPHCIVELFVSFFRLSQILCPCYCWTQNRSSKRAKYYRWPFLRVNCIQVGCLQWSSSRHIEEKCSKASHRAIAREFHSETKHKLSLSSIKALEPFFF